MEKEKKSFWCKIGLHDWEVIESTSVEQLECDTNYGFGKMRVGGVRHNLHKAICMRCKLQVDTIAPTIDRLRGEALARVKRAKIARDAWIDAEE